MPTSKKNGTIWLTGAGKGIGRALAIKLAQQGWCVAVSARSVADLQTLADEATGLAGQIIPYPLDIADAMAVQTTVLAIQNALGPLDLAILNAGVYHADSAQDFDATAMRAMVDVNLMGTVSCLAALMPAFIKRRAGRIAVVASVAGYRGLPYAAGYGATKAALIALCESLKPDLDRYGVGLSVINPGFVDTPMTRQNDFPMPFMITPEAAADRIVRGLAQGRFEIVFPRRMAIIMKIFRLLPSALALWLSSHMIRHMGRSD